MSPHLDDKQLQRFIIRETNDAAAEIILMHLSECDRCATRLKEIRIDSRHGVAAPRSAIDLGVPYETLANLPLSDEFSVSKTDPGTAATTGDSHPDERDEWSTVSHESNASSNSPVSQSSRPREVPIEPGRTIGNYVFQEQIGAGGMGVVWRATQLSTHREVAVKFINWGVSERSANRFQREVRLASALEHPSIARIYDSGTLAGQDFYAMELVEGTSLRQMKGIESPCHESIAELMAAVCDAVDFAHSKGVIHRDLKPDNVLICEDGSVRIVDFGLARSLLDDDDESSFTHDGDVLGTPAYMSPEQAAGLHQQLDHRSDVYSLGAVLYFLITGGTPPFRGTAVAVVHQVLHQDPPPPSKLGVSSVDIEAVCLKAMSKEPSNRYAKASDLAADLRRFLEGTVVSARPMGYLTAVAAWCRQPSRVREIGVATFVAALASGFLHLTVLAGAFAEAYGDRPNLWIVMVIYIFVSDIPLGICGVTTLHSKHPWRGIVMAIAGLIPALCFGVIVVNDPSVFPIKNVHESQEEVWMRWQMITTILTFLLLIQFVALYAYLSNRKLFQWRSKA